MQIILTEQEYTTLKTKAENHQYDIVEIALLNEELKKLTSNYKDLEAKYNKLLVFGVSASNERLKNRSTKQEY